MSNIDAKLQMMAGDNEGGNKRDRDDDMGSPEQMNKRPRGDGPEITLRIMIMSKNAGAIIGKGGSNIKRLRSHYNGKVNVPDCSGPERILTITAAQDDAIASLMDTIPSWDEYKQRPGKEMNKDELEVEVRMLVHQSQAGAVIGRAGFKIKELRDQSGAAIKVYQDVCPNSTERVVQIAGTLDKVSAAIHKVQKVLQDTPIKGPIQPYDPYLYNVFAARGYGGYGDPSFDRGGSGGRFGGGGGGGGRQHMGGRPMGGRHGGFGGGGGGGMGGGPRGFMSRGPGGPRRGGGGGGGGGMRGRRQQFDDYDYASDMSGDFGGGFNSGGYGGGGGGSFDDAKGESAQVTIPKELAGSIIGRNGERIKGIRKTSGAVIKIDNALPGQSDRVITITGRTEQIQNAQYLLQQSVKDNSSRY
ncbi:heterogeneous nuclear ribonucleoprotein K-like isoform X2 [Anneissia japonica]|uniref:heterogeneous nuclear ribonucleoprotein K-like isoform X2 n=1 Tax=Anneissia japonica TaxID=1529436 RepID=UPI001425862E|nr:heterogeneous nuclear ribonucleoprotein K-like isoform X2 [Anneissia japonica]